MGKTRTRTRGFRVSGLQQDREEDEFAKLDAHRPFSFHEMKSDLVLPNGARFYNDHTHPEYSTPEWSAARSGRSIALDSAFSSPPPPGATVRWAARTYRFTRITPICGHSYGCRQ